MISCKLVGQNDKLSGLCTIVGESSFSVFSSLVNSFSYDYRFQNVVFIVRQSIRNNEMSGVYAFGDFVSNKTKALLPMMFVTGLVFLVGFWTVLPP